MTFLHSEFFFWMLPPVFILFYFWQTQKPPQNRLFDETILAKLHAPEITMGLRVRNAIFMAAALLLIAAMAQPVILQDDAAAEREVKILIAMDLSKKSLPAFESEKRTVIETIRRLRGETIAVIGYDFRAYRIVPYTADTEMIVSLIEGIGSDTMQSFTSDNSLIERFRPEPEVSIIIGETIESDNTPLDGLEEKIGQIRKSQALYAHIPLFYYPLGAAMILIGIALSSMSKRRSVALSALLLLTLSGKPVHAGLLDFQTLRCGYEAYESGRYAKSAACFRTYLETHDSPEIRYNLANALYKSGSYAQALYWYRHVHTTKGVLAQRTAYNIAICESRIRFEKREKGMNKTTENRSGSEVKTPKKLTEEKPRIKTRLYPM